MPYEDDPKPKSNNQGTSDTPTAETSPIAVIGGGITGMFCAYILAKEGHPVEIFESTERWGGRIRSVRLLTEELTKREQDLRAGTEFESARLAPSTAFQMEQSNKDGIFESLDFCAEFGPMRVELDVQVLLKKLLAHLKITGEPQSLQQGCDAAHLEPFPAFSSPPSPADPLYQLKPEEEGLTPLALLSLAIRRVMVHLTLDDPIPRSEKKSCARFTDIQQELVRDLSLAAAVHEPAQPVFEVWAKELREQHYWVIQRYGRIKVEGQSVPLYAMGFWNLMANYLSHNALSKIRDLGTFYHLLPENPNAAEWLTWWLRAFSISDQLQGIYGGMACITEKLWNRMPTATTLDDATSKYPPPPPPGGITAHTNAELGSIRAGNDGRLTLTFTQRDHSPEPKKFDRVILALPKAAAERIMSESKDLRNTNNDQPGSRARTLPQLLESAFGFPMVKVFFVVRERWWEEAKRANWYATRFPTREVHYWKGHATASTRGMVMLYMDRPASSFWANYVPRGPQPDVEELYKEAASAIVKNADESERRVLRSRLKHRLVQYINDNNVPDITVDDIIWCGIWDWGRQPYGAGNHAWRPERKYWETMADLADINVRPNRHIHVCGEAYSDYHGFIEGSLRSATLALSRIPHPTTPDRNIIDRLHDAVREIPTTSDLEKKQDETDRDTQYFTDLKDWISNLESSRMKVEVVRVFTDEAGKNGNRLGVVLNGASLPGKQERQAFAASLGYSETIFIDDIGKGEIQIYTPTQELKFAGHPTVGAAWILGEHFKRPDTLVLPCGTVKTWVENGIVWVEGPLHETPDWTHERLPSWQDVEALTGPQNPEQDAHQLWAWQDKEAGKIRARVFAARYGVPQDEACGSASMHLAAKLKRELTILHGEGSIIYAKPSEDGTAQVGGRVISEGPLTGFRG